MFFSVGLASPVFILLLPILNFFTPQWLPDQNKDGFDDLVIPFGGFVKAQPAETDRPVGKLMVFSGKDGKILASAPMPDGKETFVFEGNNLASTPLLADLDGDNYLDLIYCHMTDKYDFFAATGMVVQRFETNIRISKPITWGGYMETHYRGY